MALISLVIEALIKDSGPRPRPWHNFLKLVLSALETGLWITRLVLMCCPSLPLSRVFGIDTYLDWHKCVCLAISYVI